MIMSTAQKQINDIKKGNMRFLWTIRITNGNKILNSSLNSYLEADPALLILYQYTYMKK